jgi:glycosyltransferase involved in cell wall biosynthesis
MRIRRKAYKLYNGNKKMVILKDVGLCAIVRDQKINPAGGIIEFVEAHVPYVEQAVIVDTGSLDGTREILEELKGKYPHMKIIDHRFDGYGPSRNVSLREADTKYALVLDADERLTEKDFSQIAISLNNNLADAYIFDFIHILPDGDTTRLPSHNRRMFITKLFMFYHEIVERTFSHTRHTNKHLDVSIKHFIPFPADYKSKAQEWYRGFNGDGFEAQIRNNVAPSQIPSFAKWKDPNPHRHKILANC